MKNNNLIIVVVVSLLSLSSFTISVQAATTGVGKAIISIGKVFTTSKDGKEKKLKRRGKVFEGDTIKVGKKSRLQLRFIDNQLVVLKANTVFRIDEYKFKDKNDNKKSAALTLLKGGMRSVTGLIGKSARDKYKVRTPVATMGVRGTHYILQVCSGDCGDGVKGLVGTVLEGEIEMTNDGGTSTFGTDQFFNVPSSNDAPKTMTNPPAALVSRSETESDEEGGEENGDGGDEGEGTVAADDSGDAPADDTSTTDTTTDTTTSTETTITSGEETTVETTTGTVITASTFYVGSAAPAFSGVAVSGIPEGTVDAGGLVGINSVNATINIEVVSDVGNQPVNTSVTTAFGTSSFQVNAGAIAVEQGGDATLGINWGRWNSADVTVTDESGVEFSLRNGLSFIYSDNITPDLTVLTSLGTQGYALIGGPNTLDESGGILLQDSNDPLLLLVDFAGQVVLDFGGTLIGPDSRNYSFGAAITSGVSFTDLQSGTNFGLIGFCSGGTCGEGVSIDGSSNGLFVGQNAEGFIGYFGLSDTSGTIGISGSGAFAQIPPPPL